MVLPKNKTFFVLFLIFCLLPLFSEILAQTTVRIMSYNLNDYATSSSRDADFISVISPIDPDIFVAIELTSSIGATNFRTNVLNQTGNGTYSLGTFLSNPENSADNNAIYFKSSEFSLINQSMIIPHNSYGNHPTYRFTLQHTSTGEQIVIFGVHLTSTSSGQRTTEVNIIRGITDNFSSSIYFIAAGDFNFGGGTEQAFRNLLNTSNNGYFIDPMGFTGSSNWTQKKYFSHNSSSLSSRYDFILNSQSVVNVGGIKYNNNTFNIGGNDGSSNPSVPSEYQDASDHLPVYADYSFGDPLPVELILFSGVLDEDRIELNWRTETEVNNYGFNIERSLSSQKTNWEVIEFVQGYGNSNSTKDYYYIDSDIQRSGTYYYRLKQIDNDGSFEYSDIINVDVSIPGSYYLSQNYPNPFNPETRIDFTISEKQQVSLRVYNTLGELVSEIVNEQREAGNYSEIFNASDLPSGVYIYSLQTPGFVENMKLTVLK